MINAATELYCIFGNPVRHSLSPAIHNAAFSHEGINAAYLAFEPATLKEGVNAIRNLPIRGASITIPFKTGIIPLLDVIDPLAQKIGAVNTVLNRDGILCGYNTDGEGACAAAESAAGDISSHTVLILGTGGSARAIACAMLDRGARVTIAGRMGDTQKALLDNLSEYFKNVHSVPIDAIDRETVQRQTLIINTTPLGMKPDDPLPIDTSLLTPAQTVFDIVYRPHKTSLLREAAACGCPVIHGVEMLIRQAAAQFRCWTGKDAPIDVMRRALAESA